MQNKLTEKQFEDQIESDLIKLHGYLQVSNNDYDHKLNLCPDKVIEFVKNTQEKEWNQLISKVGDSASNQLLSRLNTELTNKGLINVLRKGIKVSSIDFKFVYFTPSMSLNPNLLNKYNQNSFYVMRQFKFDGNKPHESIDMARRITGETGVHGINIFKPFPGLEINNVGLELGE